MQDKIIQFVDNKIKHLESRNFIVTSSMNIFDEKKTEIYMVKNGMLLVLYINHLDILNDSPPVYGIERCDQ